MLFAWLSLYQSGEETGGDGIIEEQNDSGVVIFFLVGGSFNVLCLAPKLWKKCVEGQV